MRLSKIVFEEDGATLTLEKDRSMLSSVKATWEGMAVNEGEPWSNTFDVSTMYRIHSATHEILMMYHGEDPTAMGKSNSSPDALFAFNLKLLELGRP